MGQRKSIEIGKKSHGAMPIPAASIKNGFLATGAVYGLAHGAAEPSNVDGQCGAMFANIETILKAAGGSLDDVIHVAVKLANPADREALNRHWVIAFPDPASRPARHVDDAPLNAGQRLVAAQVLAVLDAKA